MRKLTLNINNKDYTLKMTRNTVKWLESNGFSMEALYQKPVTYYDLIWMGLFLENYKDMNPNLAMKLMKSYEESGKKVGRVIKFAIEEYQSLMDALAAIDSEEDDEELMITEA